MAPQPRRAHGVPSPAHPTPHTARQTPSQHTLGAAAAAAAGAAFFFFLGASLAAAAGSLYEAFTLMSFPSLTLSRSALFSACLFTSIE